MILREKPLSVIRKSHEEITEEDAWTTFQRLVASEKLQFLRLSDNASKLFTYMTQACPENSFAISNSIGPQFNDPPIHGLFLLHSCFNHSCIPNSKVPITSKEILASFAIRDIVAGEEITFCYNTDFE
jgi:SET domain-containing protein